MEGGYIFLFWDNILLFEIGSVMLKANASHYYILFQYDEYRSIQHNRMVGSGFTFSTFILAACSCQPSPMLLPCRNVQPAWHDIRQDLNLQHCYENLKSGCNTIIFGLGLKEQLIF